MSASNLHSAWAALLLRKLAEVGVRDVVQSPGSRSTPLAIAAANEPSVRCHTLLDERSAAFFALGQARVTGVPSALVCTSGTAAAHYFPAVIEASLARVPMIVITADRPWEAMDCAAPQTIDQTKLFGSYVRFAAELGLPDPSVGAMSAVVRLAAQAAHLATHPEPGPVHLNARFRKPLEPVTPRGEEPWEATMRALMDRPAPRVHAPDTLASADAIDALVAACLRAKRGVIACGPARLFHDEPAQRGAVASLARATGFSIFAEATSQLRFGEGSGEVCAGFDALLRDARFRADLRPDLIIEVGAPPTSSGYATLVGEHRGASRFVLAPHGYGDPHASASSLVLGDPYDAARRVAARLEALRGDDRPSLAHRARVARAEQAEWQLVSRELAEPSLTEGAIAHRVVRALPPGALLAIGNSMPIRDLDTFTQAGGAPLRVLHQRGANGIDGLISAAAGSLSVSDGPLALLLGDLSAQHDLTGLAALADLGRPAVIVIVQNSGGRIFEMLPIAKRPELSSLFEARFATPQHLDFEAATRAFGHSFERVTEPDSLSAALASGLSRSGCTVIEAVVPPHDGAARRERLFAAVGEAVAAIDWRTAA